MKALLLLPAVVGCLLLAGCNTFKGVGEDITGAATWTQDKMSGGGSGDSVKSSDAQYVQNPPQFPKSSN
jgi:predicted small secreted protein